MARELKIKGKGGFQLKCPHCKKLVVWPNVDADKIKTPTLVCLECAGEVNINRALSSGDLTFIQKG